MQDNQDKSSTSPRALRGSITGKRLAIPPDAKRAHRKQDEPKEDQVLVEAPPKVEDSFASSAGEVAAAQEVVSQVVTEPAPSSDEILVETEPTDGKESVSPPATVLEPSAEETEPSSLAVPQDQLREPPRDFGILPELEEQPRRGSQSRILEVVLWGGAIILAAIALLTVIPLLFPGLIPGLGESSAVGQSPTLAAVAPTSTPPPTETPTPEPTATVLPETRAVPTTAPLVIPTPPSDGIVLALGPDPQLVGWMSSNDPVPHWGDPQLNVGSRDGETFSSILIFPLNNLPPDSRVLFAAVELTGRDASELDPESEWRLEMLEFQPKRAWLDGTASITNTRQLGTIGEPLLGSQLAPGVVNRFEFGPAELQLLEQQFKNGTVALHLTGPTQPDAGVVGWEAGDPNTGANAPTLHLVVVPGKYRIITNTPEPKNVLTAAAYVVRGTSQAQLRGTPTPFPPGVATATPGGEPIEVPVQVIVPGNDATAIAAAQLATAVARTTGTYTPTPKSVIIIFPTATPVIIGSEVLATATPIPPDADLSVLPIDYENCQCRGRIIALSNRFGGEQPKTPIVLEPDGTIIGQLSSDLYYRAAVAREVYSPDRKRRIIYAYNSDGIQQIATLEEETGIVDFLTNFPKGIAYDAAWAPDGSGVVFVSTETGTDEIYYYDFETEQITRLTNKENEALGQPWLKRPTWSPDSKQIAFWSSLSGRPQIWVMDRDGSNAHNISQNTFWEIDPVWVK